MRHSLIMLCIVHCFSLASEQRFESGEKGLLAENFRRLFSEEGDERGIDYCGENGSEAETVEAGTAYL